MWMSDDGEEVVIISSVKELEERTGVSPITDLHRESIDHLTIPSAKGKGLLKRVDEVFDCWFESGSMPYAQVSEHGVCPSKDVCPSTAWRAPSRAP
jgi:isoleucyl-tRNA synthetase